METRSKKRAPPSSSSSPLAKRSRTTAAKTATAAKSKNRPSTMDPADRSSNKDRAPDRAHSKGKDRVPEPSSRSRDREAERILGLPFDAGVDEFNDDGDAGILNQNLNSASSALQGLLRKLGAGFDDLLPSGALSAASSSQQSGKLKKILSGISNDGDELKQVEALSQLCDMLSMGTEDSLSSFSVDSFVPVLVGLLSHESNPDIMLLAARALTHLCEVLPSSCSAVVHYGAVPLFCARLLTIEYMDLAEQSLQALKKISQEHPTVCLRAGALLAVLQYLDFFSTGVQRVALTTAANMCKKLPSDAADFVMEVVPLLTNLFNYHDAKVLELASVCLTSISEAFASSPDKLDDLCNHGLVAQAAGLIAVSNSGGQASLSPSTYTGLIRLLSTCASGSSLSAKTLLLLGISGTLKDILSGSGLTAGASVPPAFTRPPEQIYEIVNLADELLPPLHEFTKTIVITNVPVKVSSVKRFPSSSKQDGTNEMSNKASAREKLLQEQPELLQQFGMDLLPVLTQVYTSSVNSNVKYKCLSIIGKLMYFSSADMIQSLLGVTNISSFLAGILTLKDSNILLPALRIADILMEKLPGIFSKMFIREGVIHAIDSLILTDSSTSSSAQASNSEKDPDSSAGLSSRSRRYRRRSGGLNAENSVDASKVSLQGDSPAPPVSVEVASGKSSSQHPSVSAIARSFKNKYFPTDPGAPEAGVTDELLRLKNICSKLSTYVEKVKTKAKGKSKASGAYSFDISATTEEHLDGVIKEMFFELSKYDGVSTFEFIGSGVILALLNYLSCGTFGKEKVPESVLPKLRQQALRRYKLFIATALPIEHDGNETPMTMLVQKLQRALSSLERFPVVLTNLPRSSNGSARLSSGLSALSQPIKLRLCRAHGEKSLRDYSSTVVLIDPLASLANIEEFLWSRVQRSDAEQKSSSEGNADLRPAPSGDGTPIPTSSVPGRRPSTRSRSAVTIGGPTRKDSPEGNPNSSKGKGKAVLKSNSNEAKGPQTRNATLRRGASVKDKNIKSERNDSSSEDEELDMAHVDMDDALIIEEDDISDDDGDEVLRDESLPVCVPDKVLDVKLGETDDVGSAGNDNLAQSSSGSDNRVASGRTDSTEFRSGSSFGSRGAMSFAAATMSGFASASGQGIRGGRDYRGLASGSAASDRLIFTVNGKRLSKHLTIYQAFQRHLVLDEEECERQNGSDLSNDSSRFWNDVLTITYQKADVNSQGISVFSTENSTTKSPKSKAASNSCHDTQWKQLSLLDSILQGELPCALDKSNSTYNILALLRVLEVLNQLAPKLRLQAAFDDFSERNITTLEGVYRSGSKVPPEQFVNNKITPKLARQIQDALVLCSGSLPSWCGQMTKACPFLFPFETRRQYFYSTAFGLSRALHRLQQQQHADNSSVSEREVRVGRLQRQKVRVSRNRILDSAAKVMEMYSSQKAVLEVEYFGEVGTGLGPTLEFYTLLSHDLQKTVLGLWRSSSAFADSLMQNDGDEATGKTDDHSDSTKRGTCERRDLVQAPLGLFPRPRSFNADTSNGGQLSKVIEYFRLIGRTVAKALQDGRLLDLPLSTPFYKLVLGQELDMHDILLFDAELGKVLQEMQALVSRKKYLEATNNEKEIRALRFRGASIEDLCLDFTLPGYPDFVLKEHGESTMVDINNLEEYIALVVDATLKSGISRQMEAFRSGFNQVFDISALQIFSPRELDFLICGRRELWEPGTLVDNIKFDHGYTAKSPAIVYLLEILGELTAEQQQAFCQFVTGAPRLPPGGLAALNPKLTIVRKHSTQVNPSSDGMGASDAANHDLPSVMTCANYLKLPPYATKEIMYEKLLYAINEGQGSFDLS